MNEESVLIVTTECDFMPHGLPDECSGYNIRIVTTDFKKAYAEFEKWRKAINKHMENQHYKVKIGDNFMEGDSHYWAIWKCGSNSVTTNVKIERHKVVN